MILDSERYQQKAQFYSVMNDLKDKQELIIRLTSWVVDFTLWHIGIDLS